MKFSSVAQRSAHGCVVVTTNIANGNDNEVTVVPRCQGWKEGVASWCNVRLCYKENVDTLWKMRVPPPCATETPGSAVREGGGRGRVETRRPSSSR
jgi:hypothetical protein